MIFGYDVQREEEETYNRDDSAYKQMLRDEAFDPEIDWCDAHNLPTLRGCPKCIEELQAWHRDNPRVYDVAPEDEPPF